MARDPERAAGHNAADASSIPPAARMTTRAGVMAIGLLAGTCLLSPLPAAAQVNIANVPADAVVPLLYNRGRNENVTDRARPEVQQLGLPLGSFALYPSQTVQLGYTDNVYQNAADRRSDSFVRVSPQLSLSSKWSAHSLQLFARGDFVRYANVTERNENGWSIGMLGRYDASSDIAINASADTTQLYESQFTSASVFASRNITPLQRTQARLMGDARLGRVRLVAATDFGHYSYKPVTGFDGTTIDQQGRDRSVARIAGQAEYGLTPDAGIFMQVGYSDTSYSEPLSFGLPNRSSGEVRVLAGVTFDLTMFMRGSLGIGYIDRDFRNSVYQPVKGLSLDAKVEYFPTALTSVTLVANRTVQDSTLQNGGFFSTVYAGRIDHELLRTLLINVAASHEDDKFIGLDGNARIDRISGGARYLTNRLVGGTLDLSYSRRRSTFLGQAAPGLSEFRALAGVIVHP